MAIKTNGISARRFARAIRVSEFTGGRYRRREQTPRPSVMVRIYRATQGPVTPNDFYDLPEIEARETAA